MSVIDFCFFFHFCEMSTHKNLVFLRLPNQSEQQIIKNIIMLTHILIHVHPIIELTVAGYWNYHIAIPFFFLNDFKLSFEHQIIYVNFF